MEQKPAKQVLIEARALIADPARWTQKCFARTADGDRTWSDHPDAVCWCALGAIRKVTMEGTNGRAERTAALSNNYDVADILQAQVLEPVPQFNDFRTHEEVLALFDKAIGALT